MIAGGRPVPLQGRRDTGLMPHSTHEYSDAIVCHITLKVSRTDPLWETSPTRALADRPRAPGGPMRDACRTPHEAYGMHPAHRYCLLRPCPSDSYAYCVKHAVELVTKLTRGSYSCVPSTVEQPDGSLPQPSAR